MNCGIVVMATTSRRLIGSSEIVAGASNIFVERNFEKHAMMYFPLPTIRPLVLSFLMKRKTERIDKQFQNLRLALREKE
jgi:hypothetical protein